jgi:uncharacterized protein YsxB (DUF464 family)
MVTVHIYRNKNNKVCGFSVKNHSRSVVCSAVSILTMNTINSIESFTDVDFICDYDEKNTGFLTFEIPAIKNGEHNHDVDLLFNSMVLGLSGIKSEYKRDIRIIDKEVQ